MDCVYLLGSQVPGLHENEYGHALSPAAKSHGRKRSSTLISNGESELASNASSHRHGNSLNVLADAVSSVEASTLPPPSSLAPINPYLDGYATNSGLPQGQFTLLDLELFHTFMTTGYVSLSRDNTVEVWRNNIPELAYTRDWLMRAIIAITALHAVADQEPDPQRTSELISHAATSINAGLPIFNHLVATTDFSDEPTCGALAAYTALVAVYALGMPTVQHFAFVRLGLRKPDESLEDPIGQLCSNFELIRGTAEVYRKVRNVISTGPMAPMMQVNIFNEVSDFETEYTKLIERWKVAERDNTPEQQFRILLQELLDRLKSLKRWIQELLTDVPDKQATCAMGLDTLSHVLMRIIVPDRAMSRALIFAWPATLETVFMRLLREHYPPVMALLSIFALILRNSSWLTRGWRKWILSALMEMRHVRGSSGEDVQSVWWDTVVWADQLASQHPYYLENNLEEEGFA